MSYGNGIKLTAGFDVGAKTPLDSKSVVQTIAERDAFVTDNLVYEGLEVYVKDTGHKYRYNGTSWIDLDTQSGSESGTGEGLTTEQAKQLTTAYEHSQTPHVSADDIPTNTSDLTNDSGFITSSDLPTVPTKVSDLENDRGYLTTIPEEYITETELEAKGYLTSHQDISNLQSKTDNNLATTSKEVVGAINEVKSSVDGITVPTKTSDLTNDSGFITSIPSEYITETELETKGYLTEHQSLTDYAKKTDIPDVSDFLTEVPVGYVTDTKLSTELDKKVNKEVGKGLSANDLTNELVTKINSSATEAFVTNAIANAQLGGKEVDLSGYAKTSDIPTKTSDLNNDSGFIGYPNVIVIDKGSMDAEVDLDNDIPLGRNTILLTGRVVYNTYGHELVFVYRDRESSDSFTIYTLRGDKVVVNKSNGKWSITSSTSFIYSDSAKALYQRITDNTLTTTAKTIPTAINELKSGLDGIKVPTKTSELTNNSGFITTIPEEYITETELNAKGYLTSHQDISNLALKSEIPDVSSFITSEDLPTVPTKVSDLANDKNYISSIPSEYVTETELKAKKYLTSVPSTYALKTDIPTVPTKTSDLTNDSNFITSIPTEYITETELNAKGYLTSHQDISGLQTKTDNNLATTSKEVVGAINEVKSLNDTKLNKTDANKLNCVTIDNVSLKEYILTTFTRTEEKTYYLIAKATCTDLPKASIFYITVETPGLYTYKVTAKELNDSNSIYVCNYKTLSSSWTAWEKVCTTTVADVLKTTLIPVFPSEVVVASGGVGINYVVKNGWCNVNFVFNITSATAFSWTDIATGLPKPANSANIVLMSEGGKATQPIAIKINSTGSVSSRVPSAISTADWWTGNISYPVAES